MRDRPHVKACLIVWILLFISNAQEAPLLAAPIYLDAANGVPNGDCPDFDCRRGEIAEVLVLGAQLPDGRYDAGRRRRDVA